MYRFPGSELDQPNTLLSNLSSFWNNVYQGSDLVRDLLLARTRLDRQNLINFGELLAAMSRLSIQPLHYQNWLPLTLRLSDRNTLDTPLYDSAYTFEANTAVKFGKPVADRYTIYPLPAGLANCAGIANRITNSSLTWLRGIDFEILRERSAIRFRQDPLTSGLVLLRPVFVNNVQVDTTTTVWLYGAQIDRDDLYRQFGYVLGLKLPSSDGYKRLLNAIFDSFVRGTTVQSLAQLFAAVADIALAERAGEIVQNIFSDTRSTWVLTNSNIYRLALQAVPAVAAGDTLHAGDSLSDALSFYDFSRGLVPSFDQVRALAVGKDFLASGYLQDLVFENKVVPLVVAEDADGITRVSFEIGGMPADVEKFWDDVHAAGIAAGKTLAQLLDQRTNPVGQPLAGALPATINPLGFLVQQVFRNNLIVARIKTSLFGPNRLGLAVLAALLPKIVPPHMALMFLVELAYSGDLVTMDGPEAPTIPKYEESLIPFGASTYAESVDPATFVIEQPALKQLSGYCI